MQWGPSKCRVTLNSTDTRAPSPLLSTPQALGNCREGAQRAWTCQEVHRPWAQASRDGWAGPGETQTPMAPIRRAASTHLVGRRCWLAWAGRHRGTGRRQYRGEAHGRLRERLLWERRAGGGWDRAHRQARLQRAHSHTQQLP